MLLRLLLLVLLLLLAALCRCRRSNRLASLSSPPALLLLSFYFSVSVFVVKTELGDVLPRHQVAVFGIISRIGERREKK